MSATVARSAFATLGRRAATSTFRSPAASIVATQRQFHHTPVAKKTFDHPIATIDSTVAAKLPQSSSTLFEAKKSKRLSFEEIGKAVGRDEVAVAAIFYGQAKASEEDVQNLAKILDIPAASLHEQLYGWPDRGRSMEMPPKEPLMYRLYEIVQNYGYAYKAVINEKFGDGIMSAISYSTKVEKETDEKGEWVKITLRGKWLPYTRF